MILNKALHIMDVSDSILCGRMMKMKKFIDFKDKMISQIGQVIVGKDEQIEKILVSIICGGHILLEDVPGLGKTKLARTLSKSLGLSFKRVQFTPDLLPTDLTGIYFYNQESKKFEYKEGPLKTNIVLADEINRATPRTQSALLECMEEKQMTVEGNKIQLEEPFFVIATQNPVEQFGTFPLPEAQLDRFFMRLKMGYPSKLEELEILNYYQKEDPLEKIEKCIDKELLLELKSKYKEVYVHQKIKQYIVDLCDASRKDENIILGISTRGVLALMKGVQAYAALQGRNFVIPEDVKMIFIDMMAHRIIVKRGSAKRKESIECLEKILKRVETPVSEDFEDAR